jgi:NAD(P)-dependent dehydrogenase (short-subunit alcohol dehydrogenase family)
MELPSNVMHGKTVLVTGGTGGIGKETARELAKRGATVVIIGRDAERGKTAVYELQSSTGNPAVHLLLADLSSQSEVRRLVAAFQQQFDRLHVLVNNVAGIFRRRTETVDGFEATFAVGHLAPFLLTQLLLPSLKANAPSRIVNVTSDGHTMAKLDFDDLQARRFYRGVDVYMRVKLANLLFTYELARQMAGTGITVNAVDPGGTHTQLTSSTTSDMLPPLMKVLYPLVSRFAFTSVEKAAESSVYAAAAPHLEGVTGKYFNPNLQEAKSSKASYDIEAARRLWRISEDLTRVHTEDKLAV